LKQATEIERGVQPNDLQYAGATLAPDTWAFPPELSSGAPKETL
jgi:hypothetical protein